MVKCECSSPHVKAEDRRTNKLFRKKQNQESKTVVSVSIYTVNQFTIPAKHYQPKITNNANLKNKWKQHENGTHNQNK